MKRARQNIGKPGKTPAKKPAQKQSKAGKHKKSKIGRFFKWMGIIIVFLIVMVVVLLGFGFVSEDDAFIPVDKESGKINLLLLGVDQEGLRTDAMMVASYDFDNGHVNLLSVPRDTKVYVTNRAVYRKINEVHAMHGENGEILGPEGSAEVVTQVTGIPINYYLEFSFTAIDNFMNILGSVEYDVPDVEGNGKGMNYDDPAQDLHIHLKPGLQKLTGNQVQQFLRYRKSNSGTQDGSDLSRIARQQDFVKAVIDQKVNVGLLAKLPEIFRQMKKELKTNLSLGDVAKYVRYLKDLRSENVSTFQLPGEDKYIGGGWYHVLDEDAAKTLIEQEFGYDASNITTDVTVSAIRQSAKATKKPTSTKKPVSTAKATQSPKATQKPSAKTEKPVTTKKPIKTEEPKEETKAPAKKPTQQPTEKPTKSPTRAPTKTPEKEEDDGVISID